MGTFNLHADFREYDEDPAQTKSVNIRANAQVIGAGGVIYDDGPADVVDGVLDIALPANDSEPGEFGFTITRAVGKTRRWNIPAQAPGTTVELSDYTLSTPLPVPVPSNYVTTQDLAEALAGFEGGGGLTEEQVDVLINAAVDALTAADIGAATSAQVTAAVQSAITALTAGAPAALDTLDELAAALADDANFATTVTTALGTKVNTSTYTTGLAGKTASSIITFDQVGPLAVTTGQGRIRFAAAATVLSVSATVGTAPSGAAVLVDVNKNGTTMFTTQANRPSIAASTNSSTDATPAVTSVAAGDYLSVDIDQVGSSVPGSDLVVAIRYRES